MTNGDFPTPKLARKIAKVQREAQVNALPKRTVSVTMKTGGSYSYDYIEEATLMEKIRPLLADEGVAVFYSDEIKAISGNLATVRVSLTLIDGDSGESFAMSAEGVGTDTGDKHVNKAKTAAMRYLLWKWFLVPSDIDPERENVERSEKPPRSQMKWAKKEDVDAFVEEVAVAGFDPLPTRRAVNEEFAEWEGFRADWLAGQRNAFERAKAASAKTATAKETSTGIAPKVRAKLFATLNEVKRHDDSYDEDWLHDNIRSSFEVESVNDLTNAQASEVIDFLNGKLAELTAA